MGSHLLDGGWILVCTCNPKNNLAGCTAPLWNGFPGFPDTPGLGRGRRTLASDPGDDLDIVWRG